MKRSRVDALLRELARWDLRALRELQAALGGLIEALDTEVAGQAVAQAVPLPVVPPPVAGDRTTRKPRGHIEVKFIRRAKKLHGPYRYLRYWEGGKLRSKYLGKRKEES